MTQVFLDELVLANIKVSNMRTLIIAMLFPALCFAQSWAPIGAKWHYTQQTVNPFYTSYTTVESIGDTLINGQPCRILKVLERKSPTHADTSLQYMYSDSNDRVYYLDDSTWHLLYDFQAEPGDTFELEQHYEVIIHSVDSININGHFRKVQHQITTSLGADFSGPVIKGIGNIYFRFPAPDGSRTATGPLRCYEDSLLGMYKNAFPGVGWTQDCEYVITSIPELSESTEILAYPNPLSSSKLQLELTNKINKVEVVNIFGSIIKCQQCETSCWIDFTGYPNGIYLLMIKDNSNRTTIKKIIKNDS